MRALGYKAYVISTIVDFACVLDNDYGYKAYVISTIVDKSACVACL